MKRQPLPGLLEFDTNAPGPTPKELPAPDILNKAPIRRDDDPPRRERDKIAIWPFGVMPPLPMPFDFD